MKDKVLKNDKVLIYHEKIHYRQQMEMFVVPFFAWYLIEFLIRLLVKRNWMQAYFNISFEREAYENEKNLTYLRDRKFWFFLNYL